MATKIDDRFTERARKALVLAQEEANHMQHDYLGPEHLLLGLASEEHGVAARVLKDMGADAVEIRKIVEKTVGLGDRTSHGQSPGLTGSTKRAIERAVKEARRLRHHYVGTEHLLLGAIHESDSPAASILRDLQIDLDAVRILATRTATAETPRSEHSSFEEFQPRFFGPFGPQNCAQCDAQLEPMWTYCPFCGTPAAGRCSTCRRTLPDLEGVQFCPHCGNQV